MSDRLEHPSLCLGHRTREECGGAHEDEKKASDAEDGEVHELELRIHDLLAFDADRPPLTIHDQTGGRQGMSEYFSEKRSQHLQFEENT